MLEKPLIQLFHRYIHAFNTFNVKDMLSCCTLPCVLHTPDKIAYLSDESLFINEFTQIFQLLQGAGVVQVLSSAASYSEVNPNLCIVNISWAFIDKNNDIYTDFSAFYHVAIQNNEYKITNVISHELSNAVTLDKALTVN